MLLKELFEEYCKTHTPQLETEIVNHIICEYDLKLLVCKDNEELVDTKCCLIVRGVRFICHELGVHGEPDVTDTIYAFYYLVCNAMESQATLLEFLVNFEYCAKKYLHLVNSKERPMPRRALELLQDGETEYYESQEVYNKLLRVVTKDDLELLTEIFIEFGY